MAEPPDTRTVDWSDELEYYDSQRRKLFAAGPLFEDLARLADVDVERLLIASALPERRADAELAVVEASAAGAASVLACSLGDGHIRLEWPDGTMRRMPTGANPVGPNNWLHATACALIARDAPALDILCEPAHVAASQLPDHRADAFWPFLCTAVAAAIRVPHAAGAWIDQAETLLADDKVTQGNRDVIRMRVKPIVGLLRALSRTDGDCAAALRIALMAHREYFSRHGQPGDPNRLLPLDVLGLAALAHDRRRRVDSPELPAWLVRGEFERRPIVIAFEYPPRRLDRDDDAVALLDLEGFPREGREHVIVQRGNELIARYRMRNGPGIPVAEIELALPAGAAGEAASVAPALDPCERVLLADAYAHRAQGALASRDSASARAWLEDATNQIGAALAAIPAGAESVVAEACTTARGRAFHAKEPGRFHRDRLTAYRDALTVRRQALNGAPASSTVPRPDPPFRDEALFAAEILKEMARPLLVAMARDADGAVRARLRPQPEDYAKVFMPAALDAVRAWYEPQWKAGFDIDLPAAGQTEVVIHVAPAGSFAEDNELSRHFPGAYRALAPYLNPHRVWAAWKYVRPGEKSGLAYDGLVWCDDHWSWFPKPYRALERQIRANPRGETS